MCLFLFCASEIELISGPTHYCLSELLDTVFPAQVASKLIIGCKEAINRVYFLHFYLVIQVMEDLTLTLTKMPFLIEFSVFH